MGSDTLEVSDLAKQYPTRSGALSVLDGITFRLARGDAVAITGPSGSGKSTLLHILGTLEQPTSGSVRLLGADPFSLSEPEVADFRNHRIGFVFQDHHLLPQCSVLENVLLPTLVSGGDPEAAVARAKRLLERVGLSERLEHRPAELSGGERQRVAVARAHINEPALLLADEPTGNLDQKTAATVGSLLRELHAEENTILIVVTHSLELAELLPRRGELSEGTIHWREKATT